jgi:hypothetical protein
MAALADNFHGWRPIEATPGSYIEAAAITTADEYYRGAIATTAVGAAVQIKVSNGVTTDIPFGIVTKRTTAAAAGFPLIPCYLGIVWFTGVAAIATATGLLTLYSLLNSDNPADLTATAAGNTSAFGRIISIEVTAVSGYVDQRQKAVVAETA